MRLRAVESLHYLYEETQLIPMLQLFTDRFKNRLVSMVMDKDDTVAVQAVKVCKLLLDSELLNTVETEYVCSLVFVENRAVAQAATEFLLTKLFSQVSPVMDPGICQPWPKRQNPGQLTDLPMVLTYAMPGNRGKCPGCPPWDRPWVSVLIQFVLLKQYS